MPTSVSRAVLGRMQFTLHGTRRTPHGASCLVQAMSAWLVKIRRAPSWHIRDASVYGHTTTIMHKLSTPPPPPPVQRRRLALLQSDITNPHPPSNALPHALSLQAVTSYFSQTNPNAMPYGFVPEIASLKSAAKPTTPTAASTAAANTTANTPATTATPAPTITTEAERNPSASDATISSEPSRMVTAGRTVTAGARVGAGVGAEAGLPVLPVEAVTNMGELGAFEEAAGADRLVLLDFGAEWCKNCKAMLVRREAGGRASAVFLAANLGGGGRHRLCY